MIFRTRKNYPQLLILLAIILSSHFSWVTDAIGADAVGPVGPAGPMGGTSSSEGSLSLPDSDSTPKQVPVDLPYSPASSSTTTSSQIPSSHSGTELVPLNDDAFAPSKPSTPKPPKEIPFIPSKSIATFGAVDPSY